MQTLTRIPVVSDARPRLGAVRLPALPEVLLKLLALYRRADASIDEFANLIAADPAMAGKVMAVANSAAYRASSHAEPVRDLARSLQLLGTETVRTIVISQAIFQAMHSVAALRRVDLGPYWRHSLLSAALCRELARRIGGVQEDEAYLAGLLHDIGRLALLAAAPEFHAEGLSPDDDAASCAVERRWLLVDHAEAGAWLIGRWKLSRELTDSVRYHHEPMARLAGTEPLIRIVALAHLIAHETPDVKRVAESAEICGLDLRQISEVTEQANAKLRSAAEQLGIRLDDSGTPQRSSAAAEQLEQQVEPLLVATTVLDNAVVERDEARQLQAIADTARMVFQFDAVVPMQANDGGVLAWIDSPGAQPALLQPLHGFSWPIDASPRLREAIASRRPLFLERERDSGGELAIAEDQLLRLLSADGLICLPLTWRSAGNWSGAAVLVCVGNAALLADLSVKQEFLGAFAAHAEGALHRAAKRRGEAGRQFDRQASLQIEAARDLAHEIGNPLAIIQNYLELLNVKLGTSDALSADERQDLSGDIALLQQEVARVGRLVHSLAAASPMTAAGTVDVNRLIGETVRLFRTQAEAAGISISSQLQPDSIDPDVEADALEQVLVNLVKNAVEAMSTPQAAAAARPEGAQLVVSNSGLVNRDGRLSLEINVRDNGPGMPTDMLARLFAGRPVDGIGGTGANPESKAELTRGRGLAIVHRLIQAMGATIQCRSNIAGTSFEILLPCRQPLPMTMSAGALRDR
ncbi:MAG: HDOD domain-containing protein [Ideonella sp.]